MLVVLSPIFVEDRKIIFGNNFVAPLKEIGLIRTIFDIIKSMNKLNQVIPFTPR